MSILVVAFRDAHGLRRCFAALAQQLSAWVPSETLVLSNGASEEVRFVLDHEVSGATVLRSSVNLGFAGGSNRLRAAATGEYLVLLNEDAEIEAGWLDALVETVDRDPRIGAVGGKMLDLAGGLVEAGQVIWRDGSSLGVGRQGPDDAFDYVRDVDYCSAAALLVRADAWDTIGGMDERYYPAYYEDVDLCLALRASGYRVVYQPRARFRHDWKGTAPWDFSVFLQIRNRERFREKWGEILAKFEPPTPDDPDAVMRAVLRARGVPRRLLIIDDRLPTAIGSGFGRMLETVDEMVEAGYAVTIIPGLTAMIIPGSTAETTDDTPGTAASSS